MVGLQGGSPPLLGGAPQIFYGALLLLSPQPTLCGRASVPSPWSRSRDGPWVQSAHWCALVCFSINIDTLWIATRTGSTRWRSSSGSPVPINPACCYEHAPQMEISTAPPGRSRLSFEMQRLWKLVALLGVRSFQFLFGNRPSHRMIISFCIRIGIAQLLRSVREWITFGPED